MADWRTFPKAKSLSPVGSLTLPAGGPGVFVAISRTGGPHGLIPSHSILVNRSAPLRRVSAGDVVAVATPGHTAHHISVLVQNGNTTFFLAGDTSYNEELKPAGCVDGVSANEEISRATLDAIKQTARKFPTVYLPAHDAGSAARLARSVPSI